MVHVGLSENSVPLHPMVLLIIIPTIHGYFIGGIPHFQTYLCTCNYPVLSFFGVKNNHQTTWQLDQATTAGATEGGRPRLVRTGERLTAGHGAQDVAWHG